MTERGVSYILGILSVVFAFFIPLAGLVLGLVGLFQNKKEKSKASKKLNIIGIVLSVLIAIALIFLNVYVAKTGFPTY